MDIPIHTPVLISSLLFSEPSMAPQGTVAMFSDCILQSPSFLSYKTSNHETHTSGASLAKTRVGTLEFYSLGLQFMLPRLPPLRQGSEEYNLKTTCLFDNVYFGIQVPL
jgi:hypothetical protein